MTTDLDRAFLRLDTFLQRRLPVQIRLLRTWTSFDPNRHADVLDDVRQSLALDCAEHAHAIAELDDQSLARRWHRLVSREHYVLRGRRTVSLDTAPPPKTHDTGCARFETLTPDELDLLAAMQEELVLLKNGRISLEATARRIATHPRVLRELWARLTEELGLGEAHTHFWCNRLAEALLDLVEADLRPVEPQHATHTGSDWRAFRHRFRRIHRALSVRRQSKRIRRALLGLSPRRTTEQPPAEQLLHTAEQLAPDHPRLAALRTRVRARLPDEQKQHRFAPSNRSLTRLRDQRKPESPRASG